MNENIQNMLERLVSKQEIVELVKVMKPIEIMKVLAQDHALCASDAAQLAFGLLSSVGDVQKEDYTSIPIGPPEINGNQFPPPPRARPAEFPYDAMTVAGMDPKNKAHKRSLTMGKKDSASIKVLLKKGIFDPEMSLNQPGGDGGNGTQISMKPGSGNMPGGGSSWSKQGVAGWSSSPPGKEFKLPDEE